MADPAAQVSRYLISVSKMKKKSNNSESTLYSVSILKWKIASSIFTNLYHSFYFTYMLKNDFRDHLWFDYDFHPPMGGSIHSVYHSPKT